MAKRNAIKAAAVLAVVFFTGVSHADSNEVQHTLHCEGSSVVEVVDSKKNKPLQDKGLIDHRWLVTFTVELRSESITLVEGTPFANVQLTPFSMKLKKDAATYHGWVNSGEGQLTVFRVARHSLRFNFQQGYLTDTGWNTSIATGQCYIGQPKI